MHIQFRLHVHTELLMHITHKHKHTLNRIRASCGPGLLYLSQGIGSDIIDSNGKSSSACRLTYSSFFSLTHTFELHTATVLSRVMCCCWLSSDVTNIFTGCHKQQFPPYWKALRPFRHWFYLAAVFPLMAIHEGWTSLYIISVSLDRAWAPSP